jgi:hypothetical protein
MLAVIMATASIIIRPRDRYLFFHVAHARWINWEMGRWGFNGEGVEDKAYRGGISMFFFGTLYFQRISTAEVGSFNKVYAVNHWVKQMGEVTWWNISQIVEDGWHLNYRQLPGMPAGVVAGLVYIRQCIVNREDGYLVLRVATKIASGCGNGPAAASWARTRNNSNILAICRFPPVRCMTWPMRTGGIFGWSPRAAT